MFLMKIVRLVLSIASILAFFVIFVQSCGFDPTNEHGAAYGLVVGVMFFIAGVVGSVMRKKKNLGVIAGVLYIIAAIVGFVYMNIQSYLKAWAIAALVLGVFFLVSSLLMKKELVYGEKPKFSKK
jgi:peptidoglycan/LPS O-acetylase OafA/YrhL